MSATNALATAPETTTTESVQPDSSEAIAKTVAPTKPQPAVSETLVEAPDVAVREPGEQVVGTAQATSEREEAAARIRQSTLPPALRERLAAVVEAGQSPTLDVAACLEALEESLPDFLRVNRNGVAQPTHPDGTAFFRGGDGELTDAEAETLAQQQLARSGLLRGQRVKVAD